MAVKIVTNAGETYYMRQDDVLWVSREMNKIRALRLGSFNGPVTGIDESKFVLIAGVYINKHRIDKADVYIRQVNGTSTLNMPSFAFNLPTGTDPNEVMEQIDAIKAESKLKLVARRV